MEQKHSRQDPRAAQRPPQEGRERPAARPGAGERRQTSARSETQGRRSAPAAGTRSANPLALWVRRLRRQIRRLRRRVENLRAEERAYNFPESDALPVQLLLLGWNMLPMLGSLLWERVKSARGRFVQWLGGFLGKYLGKIPRRKLGIASGASHKLGKPLLIHRSSSIRLPPSHRPTQYSHRTAPHEALRI